jgi:uncharacterized repeat protein (TIGR01451 family)
MLFRLNRILLFVVAFLFVINAQATHVAGAEITYKSIGYDKYEIFITYYRDCGGVAFSDPSSVTRLRCKTGGTVSLSLTLESIEDVTDVCASVKKPCSPVNTMNSGFGREKHVYKATVDFSKAPYNSLSSCSDIIIETGQCCRNSSITTGAANANFFTYAEMFRGDFKVNSTPVYHTAPNHTICANQPFRGSMGGVDYVDNDSLSYKLVSPLSGWNQTIGYRGHNYAYNHPFDCYYPGTLRPPAVYQNASPPIGFYFDEKTGNMVFTPVNSVEITIYAVEITEWRKNSFGVWKKVSITRRDLQISTVSCPKNNPPKLTSDVDTTFKYDYCSDNLSFILEAEDKVFVPPPPAARPAPDTVRIKPIALPDGIEHEIIDKDSLVQKLKIIVRNKFLRSLDTSDISSIQIPIEVRDNACPSNGVGYYMYTINFEKATFPRGKLKGAVVNDENSNCLYTNGEDTMAMERKVGYSDTSGTVNYFKTKVDGTFESCLPIDSITLRMMPHPWFTEKCSDTTLYVEKDTTYNLHLFSEYKDGIGGYVYLDTFSDCNKRQETVPFKQHWLRINPGNKIISTDQSGFYFYELDSNATYTVSLIKDTLNYKYRCKDSQTVVYAGGTILNDYFKVGLEEKINLKLELAANRGYRYRRGDKQVYSVKLSNLGGRTRDSVDVFLDLDKDLKVLLSSTKTTTGWTDLGNNLFKYTFRNLKPQQLASVDKMIYLEVEAVSNKFFRGDTVFSRAYIDTSYLAFDIDTTDNEIAYNQLIVAAYDPNIKATYQDSVFTTTNRTLDYSITFQNTGDDFAKNVVVRDTLPKVLNVEKIKFLGASHDYYPIINGHEIWFVFEDIYLPDSATDLDGSIGTVLFSVPLLETIYNDTFVRNSASIYFDFEEPVRTNTKVNHFKTPIELLDTTSVLCAGDTFLIPFVTNFSPSKNNVFYLDFTDTTGNFNTFTIKDSLASSDTFGIIKYAIDKDKAAGDYVIRLRSSSPKTTAFESYYRSITINQAPDITLDPSLKELCFQEEVSVSVNNTTSSTVDWYIDDTKTSSSLTFKSNSLKDGNELFCIDSLANGCVSISDTISFTVNARPEITLLSDTVKCSLSGDIEIIPSVNLSQGNGSFSSIEYAFGDGTTENKDDASFFHNYTKGKFDFTAKALTDKGCSDSIKHQFIIGAKPNSVILTGQDTVCKGQNLALISNSKSTLGEVDSVVFKLESNAYSSHKDTLEYQFNNEGIIDVELVVYDNYGCSDTSLKSIEVLSNPVAMAQSFNATRCFTDNQYVLISNSDGDYEELVWMLNGTEIQSDTLRYTAPLGTTPVALVAKNTYCADTINYTLEVLDVTEASFSIDSIQCLGQDVQLISANTALGTNYSWTDGVFGATGSNATYNPSSLGLKTIKLITESRAGCVDSFEQRIQVKPVVNSDFTVADICVGEYIQIQNLSESVGTLFDYDFGDGASSLDNSFSASISHLYNAAGSYNISQIAKLEECSDTLIQAVDVYPESIADFEVVNSTSTQFAVNITNNSVNATSNTWDFGNGENSSNTSLSFEYVYGKPGTFIITLFTDSEDGCRDTLSKGVTLEGEPVFWVPNSYTPNKNGLNDQYNIQPKELIAELNMKVYNRWGAKVADSNKTSDILPQLDHGIYSYTLSIVDIYGKKHFFNGTLHILH